MRKSDEMALRAALNEAVLNDFAEEYSNYILKCASRAAGKHITKSDDEWSIALAAFCESVKAYSPEKGEFLPFAGVVIQRRIGDLIRSRRKFSNEMSVSPDSFSGENLEEDPLSREIAEKTAYTDDLSVNYEIEALNGILHGYGFGFLDLVSCSPKARKTKETCRLAVICLLGSHENLEEMRRSHMLPINKIEKTTNLPRKILERHRKYIIAAAEILSGDFPNLSEYLRYIKEDRP